MVGANREQLIQLMKTKFCEQYQKFLGTGPLVSAIYIDSEFQNADATENDGQVKFVSSVDLYKDLLGDEQETGNSESNLIIGDSGLGKTSFALHLCEIFWNKSEYEGRIPIYIYLPSVVEHLKENILEKLFSSENVVQTLSDFKLLLILDGFDELTDHGNANIFETNGWCYPSIKTVILSRNSIYQRNKTQLFQCFPKPFDRPPFVEYSIQPFNESQVDDYISKVDSFISSKSFEELRETPWGIVKREYDQQNWNKDKYYEWFKNLPDLRDLAQTPLLLTLILQTLPVVVRSSNSIPDEVKKFSETKVGIFDSFTENWFEYQYNRLNLEESNHFQVTLPIFKTFCYAYAQNLAYSLINRDIKFPDNLGRLQENNLLPAAVNDWKMLEIVKYNHGRITSYDEVTCNKCMDEFKKPENSIILEAIRNSCLVKFVQSNDNVSFQFFHRSIAEYFVSRDIFVELQAEFEYYLVEAETFHYDRPAIGIRGLNKYILKEEAIQNYLAERVTSEQVSFRDLLFDIIDKSKEFSLISIMSANAISILNNIAGISFSGHNFEWIQIPGANLNHSLCGNTNFKGANLANVSFEDAWLAGAQFNGAKLLNTNFGLNSSFECEQQQVALSIDFSRDWDTQKWFVYSSYYNFDASTLKVIKWDLAQITKVLEFTLQDEKRKDFCNSPGFCVIDKYLMMWSEKLCIFSVKTGVIVASVLIPEMPNGQIMPFPSLYETKINEKKLFVARGSRIFQYEFFDSLMKEKDASNVKLTLIQKFKFDEDEVKYEFIENLGLVVVFIEDNKFCLSKNPEKTVEFTVEFNAIISFAIDSRPHRCHIALGGYEGLLQIRAVYSNVLVKQFKLPCAGVNVLKYSKDFQFLAASARDDDNGHFIQIWETDGWTCMNSIDLGSSKVTDLQFLSSNAKQELILGAVFSEPQDGLKFFSVLFERNRMITQKKLFPFYIESVSCSVDGSLISSVVQKHRFASENGPFLYNEHPRQYMVHVWNVENGRKMYEFDFEYDTKSFLLQMAFIVDNNIICIERTNEGKEYFYIYDQMGCLIKSRIFIAYRENCTLPDDFSTTGFNVNHTGTLIARGLSDGSVCLSDLLCIEPFLRYKCHLKVPNKNQDKIYYAAYFINFDPKNVFLVSSANDDSLNTIRFAEKCTIRIWNILNEQLLAEYCTDHFRLPHFGYFCKDQVSLIASSFNSIAVIPQQQKIKILVRFDEFSPLFMPLFDYSEKCKLIILYAAPKLIQLWNIDNHSKPKLVTAMDLWFDITFLKFIPLSDTDSNQCKILITGQSNICCLKFRTFDTCLLVEWSHSSNLSLNVKDLCLDQCIELTFFNYRELVERGAFGSIAHIGQRYIAKSNVIVPILGSSLLEPNTVFHGIIQQKGELLRLTDTQWILSAIGRRSNANNPITRLVEKHVFLTLEGIKHDRRFVFEAHLRYDKESDKVFFQIFPTTDIEAFRKRYTNCWVRQWNVNLNQGMYLIADILSDYQKLLKYKFLTKNCIKWTKRKVESLGYNFARNPLDLIVITPTTLLGRSMNDKKKKRIPRKNILK